MRIGRTGSLVGGVFVLLATAATGTLGAQQAAQPAAATGSAVITGRVQAEGGMALPAANVLIPEMNISVATNEQGQFTLTVPADRVRGQTVTIRARAIGHSPGSQQIGISSGRREVSFTLRRDVNRLSEVVVTGVAAATERVKVPFAVTRIDSSQMQVSAVNPLAALAGKVPGANIVAASGRPGVAPSVLLRGPKSINATGRSQEPLYIVDGVILNGSIADVNSQDIESIEVVKGAAAAALYGSQAANGVIQITTRKGASGRDGVKFGLRTEYGTSDVEREIGLAQRHGLLMDQTQTRFCINSGLTTAQARGCSRSVDWLGEALRINDNALDYATSTVGMAIDPGSALQAATDARSMFQTNPWPGANYNAVEQFVNPKPMAIANVDMSGKFGATDIYAALNTTGQGGAIRYLDGYRRNSVRVNAGQRVGSDLSINASTFFSRSETDGFNQEGGGQSFFRLTRTPPIVDLTRTDSKGRLLIRPNIQGGGAQNENALYFLQNVDRIDYVNRFLGSLTARYTPTTWFAADGTFGYDNADFNGRQFQNRGFRTTGPNSSPTNNGFLQNYAGGQQSLNGTLGVTFPNISPWKDLILSPGVRTQYLQQDFNFRFGQGSQLAVSDVEDLNNVTQSTLSASAQRNTVRQSTYSGTMRAEYKERYILDAAVRRDGNSTFGPEERWATYGRLAGSWIVTNEDFMQGSSDKLDLLKFTANYGTSGLAPSFVAQYEAYTVGTGGSISAQTLGNPNLRPQVDAGMEFMVEIGAFRDWNLTATYAASDTRDQILPVTVPSVTRFQQQWQNVGTMNNKTIEASLAFPVFKRNSFDWNGRFNFERTKTTVAKLDVPPFIIGANATVAQNTNQLFRVEEGVVFPSFYGRKFVSECGELPASAAAQCGGAGSQYQKNNEGLIVWTGGADLGAGYTNNLWNVTLPSANSPYTGVPLAWGHPITLRDSATGTANNVYLGQALPKFRWSLAQNVNFGRFTAYGLLDAAQGHKVFNQSRQWSYLDFLNKDQDQTGRDVADVKPMSYYYRSQDNPAGIGGLYDVLGLPVSYFTEDASFVKLREMSVTYRLGRMANLGDWTIGLTGRNLKTWTNYKGFDPEVGLNPTPVQGFQSGAGSLGSGALAAVDAFTFPNLRTFSVNFNVRF